MAHERIHGSGSEEVRKITRTAGYSYYVTIPKNFIRDLGWRERQRVRVSKQGKRIVIEKGF